MAVGTPGRLLALLARGALPSSRLSLLVLDEADKLLGESFGGDVMELVQQLPRGRQVLAVSATFSEAALATLHALCDSPRELRLCRGDAALLGVRQLFVELPRQVADRGLQADRVEALERVLRLVSFQQVVLASGPPRGRPLCCWTHPQGWPQSKPQGRCGP